MAILKKGKDILFAVNPRFKVVKDALVDFLILKVVIPADNTLEGIKSKLKKDYQISLDEFVLKETLNKLKKKDFVTTNHTSKKSDSSAKAYFHAKNNAMNLIKNISDKRHGSFELLANWLSDHIPEEYKEELLDKKEDIIIDLIRASNKISDKYFYQISSSEKYSPLWEHLECQVKGISPELKRSLEKIYDQIWTMKDPAIKELINLNFFWSAFLRIFSYEKSIQDSLSKSTGATHIFLDTNTIVADLSHFDPNHETTREYLRFLESIGLQIYYTPETFGELKRHLKRVEKVINTLKYYPLSATQIAEGCNSPLVKSYIEEDYIEWDLFYKEFMETLNSRYSCFKLSESIDRDVRSNGDRILSDVKEIMQKEKEVAKHDAYMISLVRNLRKEYGGEGFEYIYWFLTLDTSISMFDMYVGEFNPPTSIYLKRVPYYFYTHAIVNAIKDGKSKTSFDFYKLFLDAIWIVDVKGKEVSNTVSEYEAIMDKEDITKKHLEYTKEILWEGL